MMLGLHLNQDLVKVFAAWKVWIVGWVSKRNREKEKDTTGSQQSTYVEVCLNWSESFPCDSGKVVHTINQKELQVFIKTDF